MFHNYNEIEWRRGKYPLPPAVRNIIDEKVFMYRMSLYHDAIEMGYTAAMILSIINNYRFQLESYAENEIKEGIEDIYYEKTLGL